jgi:hypothetical protein
VSNYDAEWKKAKAEVEKQLGKKGKLPKPRGDVVAAMESAGKPYAKLLSQRDAMESTILEFRDAVAKVADAAESYSDIINASNFGLDEDDKEQAKQIKDAQQQLTGVLGGIADFSKKMSVNLEGINKMLAEIDKQITASKPIVCSS